MQNKTTDSPWAIKHPVRPTHPFYSMTAVIAGVASSYAVEVPESDLGSGIEQECAESARRMEQLRDPSYMKRFDGLLAR